MARGRRPLGVRAAHAKRASPRAYKGWAPPRRVP
jgi:hypothetical protein